MQLFLSALAGGVGAATVAFLLRTWAVERIQQSIALEYAKQLEQLRIALRLEAHAAEHVWLLKRDACLKALNLANAVLSNYSYVNVPVEDMVPQSETVANARACLNELACSCEEPDVITELKRIIFERVSPDAIVDLRSAVRRELGFSAEDVDTDRDKAFIGRLNCESLAKSISSPRQSSSIEVGTLP